MALSRRPTILVLRALGLGDFLTGVPALRAVRRGFPDHTVTLACPPALGPLVSLAGAADELHPCSGLEPLGWSDPPPDLAVNLHGCGPESHQRLLELTPGRLVAFRSRELGVLGPRWDDGEHEVHRWCRLVSESLQLTADPADLVLRAPGTPAVVDGAVVVHPGAAFPSRRWPPERFGAVARWAVEQGLPVVVTGGAGERDLAEKVRRHAGLPESAVLAGRTDLVELAAVVAAARLLVSGDTGVAHLASAYRTPSVVLFGPTPPSRWGPPPEGPHTVLWHGDGSGCPFADRPDPALLEVSVDEVLTAAETRLAAAQPTAAGTTRASA